MRAYGRRHRAWRRRHTQPLMLVPDEPQRHRRTRPGCSTATAPNSPRSPPPWLCSSRPRSAPAATRRLAVDPRRHAPRGIAAFLHAPGERAGGTRLRRDRHGRRGRLARRRRAARPVARPAPDAALRRHPSAPPCRGGRTGAAEHASGSTAPSRHGRTSPRHRPRRITGHVRSSRRLGLARPHQTRQRARPSPTSSPRPGHRIRPRHRAPAPSASSRTPHTPAARSCASSPRPARRRHPWPGPTLRSLRRPDRTRRLRGRHRRARSVAPHGTP